MSVELEKGNGGRAMMVRLSGKLSREDYEAFVPEAERAIRRYGKIRLLVEMQDFRGWDAGGLWADFKFDVEHFNDIERLAFVGSRSRRKGRAAFSKPFVTAEVRYFDRGQIGEARRWLQRECRVS